MIMEMYSTIMDASSDLNLHLATRIRGLRAARGLSLEGLSEKTGVSRSMISVIERGEASPTAAVLNRLAAGLGVTLASLFAEEGGPDASPLSRRADQRVWTDPESGYVRRALSPARHPSPLELAEVILPADARVAYDTGARAVGQQVWVIEGALEITTGGVTRALGSGDCLALRIDGPTVFRNAGSEPVRYLVALAADPARLPGGAIG